MHGSPAPRAAAISLAWSPAITARSATPPAGCQRCQQMARVGFARRETVAATDRGEVSAPARVPKAATAPRPPACWCIPQAASPRAPERAAPRRRPDRPACPPRRARHSRRRTRPPRRHPANQTAGGEGPLDQLRHAVAHHQRGLRLGEARQPARLHQPVQRRGQVGHRMHQRAVEVEQQGADQGVALRNAELKRQDSDRL